MRASPAPLCGEEQQSRAEESRDGKEAGVRVRERAGKERGRSADRTVSADWQQVSHRRLEDGGLPVVHEGIVIAHEAKRDFRAARLALLCILQLVEELEVARCSSVRDRRRTGGMRFARVRNVSKIERASTCRASTAMRSM